MLDYQAVLPADDMRELLLFKNFVHRHVIQNTEVQILRYKGQQIVIELYKAFNSDPQRLLPPNTRKRWENAQDIGLEKRIIADYIAGMTDEYASRMHRDLFLSS